MSVYLLTKAVLAFIYLMSEDFYVMAPDFPGFRQPTALGRDAVVGYCHYCTQGFNRVGKKNYHLAELLFKDI